MSKTLLKWLTIIVPVVFWLSVLFSASWIFDEPHSLAELIYSTVVVTAGSYFFSSWVFRYIDRREAEIHERAEQLQALNTAALALTTELELGPVLQKVVDISRELVHAHFGALGVLDEQGSSFEQFVTSGISHGERAEIGEPPSGHGVFSIMLSEGQPVRINHISTHKKAIGFPEKHPPMRTLVGVPIVSKGKVIGDLYLTDKMSHSSLEGEVAEFTEQDQQVLEMFATQAAIAIENAKLYRQVQELVLLKERERIGMDLHDGIIQSIYAIGLMLDNVQRQAREDPETAQKQITRTIHDLNDVISDIRNYILDLRPQRFQGKDLVQGLRELAQVQRANTFMTVNLDIEGERKDGFTPEQTVEILHIAQEALNNVRKHARASEVDILLQWREADLLLVIEDNGPRVNVAEFEREAGDGLRNMRERALALYGDIVIAGRKNGGTKVALQVPYNR